MRSPTTRLTPRGEAALSWIAVAVGAVIGSAGRYGLDLLLPHGLSDVPWSMIIANTLGSFLLGVLAAGTWALVPPWVRAGLGAGVLGSFTTFSSLMIIAVATAQGGELAHGPGSLEAGSLGQAVAVVVGSVFAGLLAALIGIAVGRQGIRRGLRGLRTVDDEEDA